MAKSGNMSRYSGVHRGKSRQVKNALSARNCGHDSQRPDTRVNNPLFRASDDDINKYRSARVSQPQN